MAAVIEFPAARIVRPLKKRVARPRKMAAPITPVSEGATRVACLLIDRFLRDGDTLEQMRRAFAEKPKSDDALQLQINAAIQAELRKRMGPAAVVPMSIRFTPQWPTGKRGEDLEELAQLAHKSCVRRGGTNTLEDARKHCLQALKDLETTFREKVEKGATP
jgi:hypothetical protein